MESTQKVVFFFFFTGFFFIFTGFFFICPILGESELGGVKEESSSSSINPNRREFSPGFEARKLFVFGDSYADTGNNKKCNGNKKNSDGFSWTYPYGITYPGKPSGRFSDGRVLTDFLAKFYGLKSPIPYKRTNLSAKQLRYGMNFAYGGTGLFRTDVLGPNMTTQIDLLQSLVNRNLYKKFDLKSAVAVITLSGNDYGVFITTHDDMLDILNFISTVVGQLAANMKRIHDLGMRRVVVTTLQPLGCLPRSTAQNSFTKCNDTINELVHFHNQNLRTAVETLNNGTKDSPFVILDVYGSFNKALNIKEQENKHLECHKKFENPLRPCCFGINDDTYCGSVDKNGTKMYTLCDSPTDFFFWDRAHPTQAGWRSVYYNLRSTLAKIN